MNKIKWIIACLVIYHSIQNATALTSEELTQVKTAVIEMCRGGTIEGNHQTYQVEGGINGKVVFIKGLAELGADGKIHLTDNQWKGIEAIVPAQGDQTAQVNCVVTILPILINAFGENKKEAKYYPNWQLTNPNVPYNRATMDIHLAKVARIMSQCGHCIKFVDHSVQDQYMPMNSPGSTAELDDSTCTTGIRVLLAAMVFSSGEQQAPPLARQMFDTLDIPPATKINIDVGNTAGFNAAPIECLL